MTTKEIKVRLDQIEKTKGDDEEAHTLEDNLWYDFIKSISQNYSSLGRRAQLVISSGDIEFSRWRA